MDDIVNDPNVNNYLRKVEWLNNRQINMFNLQKFVEIY